MGEGRRGNVAYDRIVWPDLRLHGELDALPFFDKSGAVAQWRGCEEASTLTEGGCGQKGVGCGRNECNV